MGTLGGTLTWAKVEGEWGEEFWDTRCGAKKTEHLPPAPSPLPPRTESPWRWAGAGQGPGVAGYPSRCRWQRGEGTESAYRQAGSLGVTEGVQRREGPP